MALDEWNLTIGEIVAPFGLAGECKVRLETDFPERYSQLKQVCLRLPNGHASLYEVAGVRPHKGQVLLRLKGVTAIEGVEVLRNALVQVRTEDAVRLPANEFYFHQLIGCEVATAEGRELGSVTAVLRGGGNDVLVIGVGKEEILLPIVKEVVREVDTQQRRIVVTPTPGLLPE